MSSTSPLAQARRSSGRALGCMIPFGLLFTVAGIAIVYFLTVRPMLLYNASLGWAEVPCTILSSGLDESTDSDGTTARVAVRYRYVWDGRTYEGDRYDFSSGRTNVGMGAMRRAVEALPPGTETTAFVDPDDPASAVLNRNLPTGTWLGAVFLLFPVFGIGMVVAAFRMRRTAFATAVSPLGAATTVASAATPAPVQQGEVRLQPSSGRIGPLIGILLIGAFWNGIVAVFIVQAVEQLRDGSAMGWFLALFLIPFVLIGALFVVGAFAAFANLFNPAVTILLDASLLRLGARVPLRWRIPGGPRRLSITLHVREEATYKQGTSTTTDRADCHRAEVFVSDDPSTLRVGEGAAELRLPSHPTVAPPLAASNNKLVWQLVVRTRLPWRIPLEERFNLPVRGPASVEPPAAADPVTIDGDGVTLFAPARAAPGDTLPVAVVRDRAAKGGPVTVQLGWYTDGRGTRDAAIAFTETIAVLEPGGHHHIDVHVPEAPWTFQGKLISVAWRLEVLDAARRPLAGTDLVVGPGGVPAQLAALDAERGWSPLRFWFT